MEAKTEIGSILDEEIIISVLIDFSYSTQNVTHTETESYIIKNKSGKIFFCYNRFHRRQLQAGGY